MLPLAGRCARKARDRRRRLFVAPVGRPANRQKCGTRRDMSAAQTQIEFRHSRRDAAMFVSSRAPARTMINGAARVHARARAHCHGPNDVIRPIYGGSQIFCAFWRRLKQNTNARARARTPAHFHVCPLPPFCQRGDAQRRAAPQ